MRTLVTGGSGYLGELLVQQLASEGRAVRVFDRVDNADRVPAVEFVQGDVRNASQVRRALEGVDVVHHNVAQVPLAKDRAAFWSVNVGGTRNVLRAAVDAGVRKVVVVSSSAIYGIPEANPVDLDTLPRPREAYGRAKLAAEHVARDFISRGLDVTLIRPRTILGHGRLGIFQLLFEWVKRGRPLYLLGSGHNRYQFVHASDLVALCLAADSRPGPSVALAGTTDFGTMRELLEGLVTHARTGSPVRSLPFRATQLLMGVTSKLGLSPLGDYHALMYGREMYFDVESTRAQFDWTPQYSNAAMIAESYDWYIAHRDSVLARENASHHRSPVRPGILKLLDLLP